MELVRAASLGPFDLFYSPSSAVSVIVAFITQVTAIIFLRFSVFLVIVLLPLPSMDSFPAVSTPNQLRVGLPSHHSAFIIVALIPEPKSLRIASVSGNA